MSRLLIFVVVVVEEFPRKNRRTEGGWIFFSNPLKTLQTYIRTSVGLQYCTLLQNWRMAACLHIVCFRVWTCPGSLSVLSGSWKIFESDLEWVSKTQKALKGIQDWSNPKTGNVQTPRHPPILQQGTVPSNFSERLLLN